MFNYNVLMTTLDSVDIIIHYLSLKLLDGA